MTHLDAVTNESVANLAKKSKLNTLGVSYCRNLTNVFFDSLAKAKLKFREVRMDGCGPLNNEALAILEYSKGSLIHLSMQSIKFVCFDNLGQNRCKVLQDGVRLL